MPSRGQEAPQRAPALALWLVEVRGFGVEGVFAALIAASSLAWLGLLARWAHRVLPAPARAPDRR